jgi:uncharacterized integral membrane protein
MRSFPNGFIRSKTMYIPLIITFLFILVIIIAAIQNNITTEISFITWKFTLTLSSLMVYCSILGVAIMAVLALPKLAMKHLKVRRLNKEIIELKKRAIDMEQEQDEN